MKKIIFICFTFILFQKILSSKSFTEVFDKIMKRFQCSIQSTFIKKYSKYDVVLSNIKFLHPILSKVEKIETVDSFRANNIIITITAHFGAEVYNSPMSFIRPFIIFQTTIDSMILKVNKHTDTIILSDLIISNLYLDKHHDFMTSSFFNEFQDDINNNIKNYITGVIRKNIEILLMSQNDSTEN